MDFCEDFCLTPVPSKTKLLIFTPKKSNILDVLTSTTPVSLDGVNIEPSLEAEHVGVLRSRSASNLPAVNLQMSKHRKALHSILAFGSSRSHLGNPAASLKVEILYARPVLLSELCTLLLNKYQLNLLSHYLKSTLQRIQKLYSRTPSPAVHFLAGSVPFTACYHMGCLLLFGRVARLSPDNPLFSFAEYSLKLSLKDSWFSFIQSLTSKYSLPDPLDMLKYPP